MTSPCAGLSSTMQMMAKLGLVALAATLAAAGALAQTAGSAGSVSLDVTVSGISNDKGQVRLALCLPDSGFPDCGSRAVRTATVKAYRGQARASFGQLAPGTYAVSVFHDANGNGRLDTFLGVPREGYGFSRNPALRMRAPRFEEAQITVKGATAATIDLRYIF